MNQISSAARSICANFAEGCEANTTNAFVQFLGYAKRSAGEVRSHLFDARDEGYITDLEFSELTALCLKISRMLSNLIRYLQKTEIKRRNI